MKYCLISIWVLFFAATARASFPTNDLVANIHIVPACTDMEYSNFVISNDNPFSVTINYSGGPIEGSCIVPGKCSQIIYVLKNTTVSSYYNGILRKQLATSDQKCTDNPFPYYLIEALPLGSYDTTSVYSVTNNNNAAVGLTATPGGGSSFSFTLAALSRTLLVTPGTAVDLTYESTLFATIHPSTVAWPGRSIITANPLCFDADAATFELQNNDDTAHDVVLRNGSGIEHRYALGAYEQRTVTIENTDWQIRLVSAGVVGTADRVIDDHFQIGSVSPANASALSLSTSAATLDYHPGARMVGVTANARWTAQSDQSWLTATSSGTGDGILVLAAHENTATAARTATATVSVGCANNQTVTITQTGADAVIAYDANNATSGTAPDPQTKTYDVALTLATNTGNLARTGYTFSEWNTAADGTGTTYAEGASYTDNASLDLYAKWTANAYTVTSTGRAAAGAAARSARHTALPCPRPRPRHGRATPLGATTREPVDLEPNTTPRPWRVRKTGTFPRTRPCTRCGRRTRTR